MPGEAGAALSRRMLLAGAAAAAGGGAFLVLRPGPAPAERQLAPDEALALAEAGKLLIVDIRRPDEWRRTGVAAPARTLDMRRPDFAEALAALRQAAGGPLPVALICARGVRSRRLARRLGDAGVTALADIPEGMEGSAAGPGWVARGLPLRRHEAASDGDEG